MPFKSKEAYLEYCKNWRKTNLTKRISYNKEWVKQNPERNRAHHRKYRTGWRPEAYEKAWVDQDGRCAICGTKMIRTGHRKNSAYADHNHDTKKPREIVCHTCNTGFGFYERFHIQCKEYLSRHRRK